MKLTPKIAIIFILIAIVPVVIVGLLAYGNSRQTIEQETEDHLISTNLLKNSELDRWIGSNKQSIQELAQHLQVVQSAAVLASHDSSTHEYQEAWRNVVEDQLKPLLRYSGFSELFLMCPRHGIILASSDERQEGKHREQQPYFSEGRNATYVQGIYYSPVLEQPAMTISTPVKDKQGNLVGVLAGRLDLGELSKIMVLQSGLSYSEDTYLVNSFNFFITEPRFGQNYALKKAVHTEGVKVALAGKNGVGFYRDYRGVPVIGAYHWLPEYEVALITEIDQAEAYAPIVRLGWGIAGISVLIASIVSLLALFLARTITRPILQLVAGASEIGSGNLDHKVGTGTRDEIGELSRAFDRMTAELKKTTVSRDKLEQRVIERTAQLEAANRELESFTYSVSHDLRSPLRGINGWSQALLEEYKDKLDEQGHQYLSRVRAETQRMAQLIDDLLMFSRQARGMMEWRRFDMTAMIQTIASRLPPSHSNHPVEFVIQPGIIAEGDSHLLEIALFNLLDNAVKFSSKNSHGRIEFGAIEKDGNRAFFVRDNGVGFDMAYAHKLFGVFQRLHKSTEFPGTGIGLATVQRIINRHGGRIWAEAQVNQGATFYFTLKEAA